MPCQCSYRCGRYVAASGLTCRKCAQEHDVPCNPNPPTAEERAYRARKNARSSAKTSAEKRRAAIEYELETGDDTIDLSDAALEAAGLRCIKVIEERIEECKVEHPEGFMLSIYGTSTGSHSIEAEGKKQFSGRGYSIPPIVDRNGNVIAMGVSGAHGPGGMVARLCHRNAMGAHY